MVEDPPAPDPGRPRPSWTAPPPLIARAPATNDTVLGPPMPSRTRAAAVPGSRRQHCSASAAATESVVGVFFSSLLGGSLPTIPGTDGVPIVILGPSIGLMLLAVVNSELGRGRNGPQ